MGTRATYCFWNEGNPSNLANAWKTTFYIHWDGYYEGAASYFLAMLEVENCRGYWADRFHRANPNAELTKSHNWHGDTEFWYDIFTSDGVLYVTAQKIELFWLKDERQVTENVTLPIDQFITRYPDYCNQVSFPLSGTDTQITMYRQFKDKLDYLLGCPSAIGNCSSSIHDISRLINKGLLLPESILIPLTKLRDCPFNDLTESFIAKHAQAIADKITTKGEEAHAQV